MAAHEDRARQIAKMTPYGRGEHEIGLDRGCPWLPGARQRARLQPELLEQHMLPAGGRGRRAQQRLQLLALYQHTQGIQGFRV